MADLFDLIRAIAGRADGPRLLGICFGAQAIAHALGAGGAGALAYFAAAAAVGGASRAAAHEPRVHACVGGVVSANPGGVFHIGREGVRVTPAWAHHPWGAAVAATVGDGGSGGGSITLYAYESHGYCVEVLPAGA